MLDAHPLMLMVGIDWGWALGLAGSMMGLTALAGLLNLARREELSLWLMGALDETSWSKSFIGLFDAVFGHRHLSLKCFLRSALASLIAVVVIWLVMGSTDSIGLRLQAELDLGTLLVLGLVINVAADYVSLLETRFLLGHMPRHALAQVGMLVLDLLISAAIIWLAIFAFLNSPLHAGDIESFAEILGVFSVFSVFFYSTFLTSLWTWGVPGLDLDPADLHAPSAGRLAGCRGTTRADPVECCGHRHAGGCAGDVGSADPGRP